MNAIDLLSVVKVIFLCAGGVFIILFLIHCIQDIREERACKERMKAATTTADLARAVATNQARSVERVGSAYRWLKVGMVLYVISSILTATMRIIGG